MTSQVKGYQSSIEDGSMGYRTFKEVKFMKVVLLGLCLVMQVYADGEIWVYDGDHGNLDNFAVAAYRFNGTDVIENDPKFGYDTEIASDIYYDDRANCDQFALKKYNTNTMYVFEKDDTVNDTNTYFMEPVSMGFNMMFCILFIYCIYYIAKTNLFRKLFGKLRRKRSKYFVYILFILCLILCTAGSEENSKDFEKVLIERMENQIRPMEFERNKSKEYVKIPCFTCRIKERLFTKIILYGLIAFKLITYYFFFNLIITKASSEGEDHYAIVKEHFPVVLLTAWDIPLRFLFNRWINDTGTYYVKCIIDFVEIILQVSNLEITSWNLVKPTFFIPCFEVSAMIVVLYQNLVGPLSNTQIESRTSNIKYLEGEFGTVYKYSITNIIEKGTTGTVFQGIIADGQDNKKVAIKKVKKQNPDSSLSDEISIITKLKNPGHSNIIRLLDIIGKSKEGDDFDYIITEYCSKGTLWDLFKNKKPKSEKEAKKLLVGVFKAIEYMHKKNIIHGDIKLNNIVLEEIDGKYQTFIIDFDYSYVQGKKKYTIVEASLYNPPEVMQEEDYNGKAADIWSLGATSYMLLTGKKIPKTKQGYADVENFDWSKIPKNAQDLIREMLKDDPEDRITIQNALAHSWF